MNNKLLTRMFEELKTNEEAITRANATSIMKIFNHDGDISFGVPGMGYNFEIAPNVIKLGFILTLLSRKDGKAVMSFLDVPSKNYYDPYDLEGVKNGEYESQLAGSPYYYGEHAEEGFKLGKRNAEPETLLDLLRYEFTEALGNGKTLDEALDIIDKIYCEYE